MSGAGQVPIILVSNGGPHPSDKWANLSANQVGNLVVIDEKACSPEAAAARKAKPRFIIDAADALEAVFDKCQAAEQANVKQKPNIKRHDPFSVDGFVSEGVAAVVKAAKNTPFEQHFSTPAAQAAVGNFLKQNLIDAANISRSWALDAKGL